MPPGSKHLCPARLAAAILAVAAASSVARAQETLNEGQTLVIYDSRIADSLAVAEHYAGSLKIPGGVGSLPGTRPGVRVCDLASTGALVTAPGNISYPDFIARLRDPIRQFLADQGLVFDIRCLVLTKGLPHRIQDTDNANVGDNPANFVTEINLSDATCASVDSELTLLWQSLTTGEAGGSSDSKADGMILNPYWRSRLPIATWSTTNIQSAKTFTVGNTPGPLWQGTTSGTVALRTTPGDMYLVCRLDAKTLADATSLIDRARFLVVDVDQVALLFDKDPANLDNLPAPFALLDNGEDYTTAANAIISDGRFPASNTVLANPTAGVTLDLAAGASNFFVGPLLSFTPGQGRLVTAPVLLLASYGSNHNGVPTLLAGGSSGTVYATSFTYSDGAIFNTIESYNGRDFGGLGGNPSVPQQQASDFLAAGGTFAIAHVWEPLAATVADNTVLVQNFVNGELSWAEAAWSSIPVLSWMHIVVGDPLARLHRTSEDLNLDLDVDINDLHAWTQNPVDINRSGAADDADRQLLLRAIRAGDRADLVNTRP